MVDEWYFLFLSKQFVSVICYTLQSRGKLFPAIYTFMSNKEENSYEELFKLIRANLFPYNLQNVVLDFELAPRNAIVKVFSSVKVHTCMFHLGQIFWRNIQRYSLVQEYKSNSRLRFLMKNILSLAFLPNEVLILNAFEKN